MTGQLFDTIIMDNIIKEKILENTGNRGEPP